jgi:succinate dehydrogenase/fumarate reductase cytochrome b subunit
MEKKESIQFRPPLKHGEMDPNRWRSTRIGMWAWLCQRISALVIIAFLGLHLTLTYRPFLQFLLLLAVAFHGVLGLRVILLDFGVVHIRYQKALLGGLGLLGLIMMIIIWTSIY